MPTPRDYDADPGRYRLGMRLTARHCAPGVNLQARILEHLGAAHAATALDAGCADGALAEAAAGRALRVIGLDAAAPMVAAARAHGPVLRGDVTALPVADASVDADLRVRFVPPEEARRIADAVARRGPLPLPVTKRGALLLARRWQRS